MLHFPHIKGPLLWLASICVLFWGEKNNGVFIVVKEVGGKKFGLLIVSMSPLGCWRVRIGVITLRNYHA